MKIKTLIKIIVYNKFRITTASRSRINNIIATKKLATNGNNPARALKDEVTGKKKEILIRFAVYKHIPKYV